MFNHPIEIAVKSHVFATAFSAVAYFEHSAPHQHLPRPTNDQCNLATSTDEAWMSSSFGFDKMIPFLTVQGQEHDILEGLEYRITGTSNALGPHLDIVQHDENDHARLHASDFAIVYVSAVDMLQIAPVDNDGLGRVKVSLTNFPPQGRIRVLDLPSVEGRGRSVDLRPGDEISIQDFPMPMTVGYKLDQAGIQIDSSVPQAEVEIQDSANQTVRDDLPQTQHGSRGFVAVNTPVTSRMRPDIVKETPTITRNRQFDAIGSGVGNDPGNDQSSYQTAPNDPSSIASTNGTSSKHIPIEDSDDNAVDNFGSAREEITPKKATAKLNPFARKSKRRIVSSGEDTNEKMTKGALEIHDGHVQHKANMETSPLLSVEPTMDNDAPVVDDETTQSEAEEAQEEEMDVVNGDAPMHDSTVPVASQASLPSSTGSPHKRTRDVAGLRTPRARTYGKRRKVEPEPEPQLEISATSTQSNIEVTPAVIHTTRSKNKLNVPTSTKKPSASPQLSQSPAASAKSRSSPRKASQTETKPEVVLTSSGIPDRPALFKFLKSNCVVKDVVTESTDFIW